MSARPIQSRTHKKIQRFFLKSAKFTVIFFTALGALYAPLSPVAFIPQANAATQTIYLTSGTTWTIPSDWNNNANKIEVIGGGAGGFGGAAGASGGGGGAYSMIRNLTLTPDGSATIQVGGGGGTGASGTDTYFNGASCAASSVCAKAGSVGTATVGGAGGVAANGIGTTKLSGGTGGAGAATGTTGGGGGGAAGPRGAGGTGGAGNNTAGGGGGGGGGNGGATATGSAGTTTGGAGANNIDATGTGGAGGSSNNGTAGTDGKGGGGGDATFVGGNGGNGTEWSASYGSGAGGGGAGDVTNSTDVGGNGGTYGGGGGGGFTGFGGTGGAGLIVITYLPGTTTTTYVTSGTTWTVPDDFDPNTNWVEVIGGGGGARNDTATNGGGSGGGGGGGYAFNSNINLTPGASVTVQVGTGGPVGTAGGDTYFNGASCAASSACAKGGSGATNATGAAGGLATGVGINRMRGGTGGSGSGTGDIGGGGGGAAGPRGPGGGVGTITAATTNGGSGGGGNGGGASSGNAGTAGSAGGNGVGGSGGGTLGNGAAGGNATAASGGGGGGGDAGFAGGNGATGTEWDSTHGSGGGGGGTGDGGKGGAGALYGGGGGGGSGVNPSAGVGGDGIIAVTYVPRVNVFLGNGTDGSSSTIAPGASATEIGRFSLKTGMSTDTATGLTVTLAGDASAYTNIATVDVQTTGGVSKCSNSSLSSNTVLLTSCAIAVTTSLTEYVIKITPKTHANMPAIPGASYATTATVTSVTVTNTVYGSDTGSATITVDNASPAAVTAATAEADDTLVTLAWTNPVDADFTTGGTVVVLRRPTSAVATVPVEGTTYSVGNTIGTATVACVVAGSPPALTCSDTGVTNGTVYHYAIFTQDSRGNYDAGVVPTGSPATPAALTITQSAYRVFENTDAAVFGTAGVITGAAASEHANAIATDSTYMYVAGFSDGADFRIEKRLLSTGAVDNGFGTSGVITGAAAGNTALAIAIDSTYMYVAGYDDNTNWHIEKRLLSTGAVDNGFGTSGVITGAAASEYANAIATDSTYMYVAGYDSNNDFRIEKRLLSTGAVDNGFGTSGVITGDAASNTALAIAIDGTYMYVAGKSNDFRIEKRLLSTGAVDNGFGTSGIVTGDAASDSVEDIAIDGTYMYVAGYDANVDFRIEKRLLSTGAVDNGFGTSGVITGAAAGQVANAISIDSAYMYVAGFDSSTNWRIEKRLLSTGAVDNGFGTSGVITGAAASDNTRGIAVDSTYMYVTGYDSSTNWRIEKRLLSDGDLVVGTSPGAPLAAQDTAASLTSAGSVFRLRELLAIEGNVGSSRHFKLQYAEKSGTCDASFTGETYADVTDASPISFYNNTNYADGNTASAKISDPTSGRTINYQTYVEVNSFTNSVSSIPGGQDGLWDISLYDNGAAAGTSYCLRTVRSDGGGAVDNDFGISGVITSAAGYQAAGVSIDGTYMYVAGRDGNVDWRIEKRLLSTGAVDNGFGTSGVITGAATSYAVDDMAIDGTYMYVTGFNSSFNTHIEKRLLSTGAVDNGFGTSGVITGDAVSNGGNAIAIDSTYMYVVGNNDTTDWRIEKRLLSTGAVDNGFGTSGVITGAAASTNAYDIAIDGTYMYVVGYDSTGDFRIEKRLLSTGAVDNGFGTSGVITGAAASQIANDIAIDSTYMYVTGYDSNSDMRIEKRLLSTGAVDNGFGTSGVVTGAALSNNTRSIAIDSTYMYVTGYDDNSDARIEKRLLSTGVVDNSFGTSGVITGDTASEYPTDIAIDSTYMYVVGFDSSYDWRIEKRILNVTTLLTSYTVIPEIAIYGGGAAVYTQVAYRFFENANSTDVGSVLAAANTNASLSSTHAPFRLRVLVGATGSQVAQNGQTFKLQYAEKSGTCDASFTGETYADVSSSTSMAFYNNFVPEDRAVLTTNANDPTSGTTVNQIYVESNTFGNTQAAIPAGQNGKWDFALYDKGRSDSVSYCFRIVKSDGTPFTTYTHIPEIVTAIYRSRGGGGGNAGGENSATPGNTQTGGGATGGGGNAGGEAGQGDPNPTTGGSGGGGGASGDSGFIFESRFLASAAGLPIDILAFIKKIFS